MLVSSDSVKLFCIRIEKGHILNFKFLLATRFYLYVYVYVCSSHMVIDHSHGSWKEFRETVKVFLFLRLPSSIKALLVTSDRKPSKTTLSSYLMIFMGAYHQQVNQSTSKIRESAPGTRAFSSGSRTWDHNTVRSFLLSIHLISASLFSLYMLVELFPSTEKLSPHGTECSTCQLKLSTEKEIFSFSSVLVSIPGKDPNCSCFN